MEEDVKQDTDFILWTLERNLHAHTPAQDQVILFLAAFLTLKQMASVHCYFRECSL